MEPSLHLKQGLNLLDRVLQFYPLMQEGNVSTVVLTEQDWMVLMDFTENPDAPAIRPAAVKGMTIDRASRTIKVETGDCVVDVVMG